MLENEEAKNKENGYFKDIEGLLKESAKHIEFLFKAGWSDKAYAVLLR